MAYERRTSRRRSGASARPRSTARSSTRSRRGDQERAAALVRENFTTALPELSAEPDARVSGASRPQRRADLDRRQHDPDPQQRRQRDVHPDHLGRHLELVLHEPEHALQRPSAGTRARAGARARRRRRGGARPTSTAIASTPSAAASAPWRSISQPTVSAPLNASRSTTSPVPEPPACGPGGGRGGAREQRHAAEREQRPHPARHRPGRPRARPGCHAGRARQTSAPAATRITIESAKWAITQPGASP